MINFGLNLVLVMTFAALIALFYWAVLQDRLGDKPGQTGPFRMADPEEPAATKAWQRARAAPERRLSRRERLWAAEEAAARPVDPDPPPAAPDPTPRPHAADPTRPPGDGRDRPWLR